MTDFNAGGHAPATSIDSRILAHLLTESLDLLEQVQIQAFLGDESAESNRALASALGQVAGTCGWLTMQMNASQMTPATPRLQFTVHNSGGANPDVADELRLLSNQAQRLHDRACKLDSLIHGEDVDQPTEQGPSAEIIAFPSGEDREPDSDVEENPVLRAQTRLNWVFADS